MALPYLIFFSISNFCLSLFDSQGQNNITNFKACFKFIEKKFLNEFITIKSNKEKKSTSRFKFKLKIIVENHFLKQLKPF